MKQRAKSLGEAAGKAIDMNIRDVFTDKRFRPVEHLSIGKRLKYEFGVKIMKIRKTIAEWVYGDIIYDDCD